MAQPPIKKRVLASYGQLALPLAIADLPLSIYLTAFYGSLGVPLDSMAWVLLLARLTDVVTDPMIGIFSDRSAHWTLGRRKAWVLMGIPLKMIAIYMVFFAAPGVTAGYMLLWLFVLYLGWTMVSIPYGAWGAELSGDYRERTRITGYRTLFGFVGILIATLAPAVTGGGAGTPEGLTPVMQGLGLWSLIMFPLSALLLWRFVPEPPVRDAGGVTGWLKGIQIASGNAAFMRILFATAIGRIGSVINTTVVVWFFIFAMGLGTYAGLPLIIYLLAATLGVPVWIILGQRFAKHNALIVAVLSSIVCFAFLLVVPPGNLLLACIVMAMAGLGGGAAATLGQSMAADVIDLDELRARKSRAGLLIAFWGMGGKLADAVGGFIALMILSAFGFSATSATNTPEAIWGLTITYILVPWPFFLISIALLWNFPLTAERQARIRNMIERRAAKAARA
jgi:Na+/melibiose symporter-like transporter